MARSRFFHWFFYGHVWIALAATGLSWLSLRIAYGYQDCVSEWPVLSFIFFATLGTYTLHRYLSFQRAGERPSTVRYGIVAQHPQASLIVGGSSILIAGYFGLSFIKSIWPALLVAVPITIFYLTPPLPGWRRLRDLPYLKNLWVALAWTIMTVVVPVIILEPKLAWYYNYEQTTGLINIFSCSYGFPLSLNNLSLELAIRFIFTGCIALLFDLRDLTLDRSQGVKTIASELPKLHRILVYGGLTASAFLSLLIYSNTCIFPGFETALTVAYLLMIPLAYYTYRKADEDWYAVVVNGLLLLPPLAYYVADIFFEGAYAGAGFG